MARDIVVARPAVLPANPVLVIMGVAGSGKSTVAEGLQDVLGWDYAEGDAFHPQANIDKMTAGNPLTDEDRWPWLELIAQWIHAHEEAGTPALVTSSALKRKYRDVLAGPSVVFVYLKGSRACIEDRMRAREGHFMPVALLDSQFAILEEPQPDEAALVVDLDSGADVAAEVAAIVAALGPRAHRIDHPGPTAPGNGEED
jgi:gluconokinase/shikimate kinase